MSHIIGGGACRSDRIGASRPGERVARFRKFAGTSARLSIARHSHRVPLRSTVWHLSARIKRDRLGRDIGHARRQSPLP
ncbi:hypothetical protein QE369_002845 [Agrobacterium larrymoorei]|uniref:Uncharacterized protein n=1 Tax=Agrobacterium larrymoorei TaxID=160699 RepID=A0AAJ2BF54_9HYPH|nr:hypothetical protein [Agrobacterium larrymoorei]MDR6102648.1 hypothetical protein [Agrobacterium larrymoorei]